MDVDLLSKMLKELILDNDRVTLPGMGAFIAEVVPSSFSDRGYTINPPYRKLYFRAKTEDDKLLVNLYASSNGLEQSTAEKLILEFTSELKEHLFSRKNVILPGLGRLRATKENDIFFIPDEDLDIYPAGYGLQPVSLKTHQETPEEVSAAVENLKSIIDPPQTSSKPEVAAEREPIEEAEATPIAEPVAEPMPIAEPTPIAEPMPIAEPEPIAEPMPMPIAEPEPIAEPTPIAEPMPITEPIAEENEEIEEAYEESEKVDEEAQEMEETVPIRPKVRPKRVFPPVLKKILIILAIAAAAIAVFLIGFVVLAEYCPDFIDSILYTEEELRIMNSTR